MAREVAFATETFETLVNLLACHREYSKFVDDPLHLVFNNMAICKAASHIEPHYGVESCRIFCGKTQVIDAVFPDDVREQLAAVAKAVSKTPDHIFEETPEITFIFVYDNATVVAEANYKSKTIDFEPICSLRFVYSQDAPTSSAEVDEFRRTVWNTYFCF